MQIFPIACPQVETSIIALQTLCLVPLFVVSGAFIFFPLLKLLNNRGEAPLVSDVSKGLRMEVRQDFSVNPETPHDQMCLNLGTSAVCPFFSFFFLLLLVDAIEPK